MHVSCREEKKKRKKKNSCRNGRQFQNKSVAKGYLCKSQLWFTFLPVVLNSVWRLLCDMQDEKSVCIFNYLCNVIIFSMSIFIAEHVIEEKVLFFPQLTIVGNLWTHSVFVMSYKKAADSKTS